MTTVEIIRTHIEARETRSTWSKAVKVDALSLLENYEEMTRYYGKDAESVEELKSWLLNGAKDWRQYSWGGCALIYNSDIAEHYCTPSEFKRRKGGEWRPNRYEEWLDVQARALGQAAKIIATTYRRYCK